MSEPDIGLDATSRLPAHWKPPLVSEHAFVVPDEPLAQGGMARIFVAEDRRLPRDVILKVPRDEPDLPAADRASFVARMEAEAMVLSRLQHPSIVTLYELGQRTGGTPFCVLEKVEGSSLRDHLDRLEDEEGGGPLRTAARLELVAGLVAIAEAVAYAHERGIVHRDVTPNNILLGARGEMTLIDWGLAKDTTVGGPDPAAASVASAVDGATICAGTPPYVCFEQTQGQPADPTYDVYSLGVTLYEVVSGRTPYRWSLPSDPEQRGAALLAFVRWAQRRAAVPPAAPRDPELSGIIARAMARDAADRFTADELVRALKQYLTGELVFSHRYSATGRLGRWARRHRGMALAALVAASAVIVAALAWTTARARDAERAQERARDEALLLAQQVEAAEAGTRAAQAESRAQQAEEAARKAAAAGTASQELQREAERLRRDAERQAAAARVAAADASDTATEAQQQWQAAIAERDAALAARDAADVARAAAEQQRGAADVARATAEQQRDAATSARDAAAAARTTAEQQRDAATSARDAAEQQRDAATSARDAAAAARQAAERERDDANAARDGVDAARRAAEQQRDAAEQQRDAAQARVRALEARVAELEAGGGGGGGDAPPPPP